MEKNTPATEEQLNTANEPVQETETNAEIEPVQETKTNEVYENTLKSIFNVAQDEELGDVSKRLADYTQAINAKIITAEIKATHGYDNKLLEKVIDRTNIKVSDDGTVTGLATAIAAAEKEYPAIKKQTKPYAHLNPPETNTITNNMNDLIRGRRSI